MITFVLGLLAGTVVAPLLESGQGSTEQPADTPDDASADGGTTVVDATEQRPDGVLQQLWVIDELEAIDLAGDVVDVAAPLLEMVETMAGEPVPISASASFAPAPDFTTSMVDVDGEEVGGADVIGGVVEVDGDRAVALLATPEPGTWLIGDNHSLRFDLPSEPALAHGTPLLMDHLYAQFVPVEGATGVDDDLAPLELLAARAREGAAAYFHDEDGDSLLVDDHVGAAVTPTLASADAAADEAAPQADAPTGDQPSPHGSPSPDQSPSPQDQPATESTEEARGHLTAAAEVLAASDDGASSTRRRLGDLADKAGQRAYDAANEQLVDTITKEVAEQADVPADARPLIEGIQKGALESLKGPCRSATCIKDLTDQIEEGFKESLDRIDEKLRIDPDRDPDTDPRPDREPDPDPDPDRDPDRRPPPDPDPDPRRPPDPDPDDDPDPDPDPDPEPDPDPDPEPEPEPDPDPDPDPDPGPPGGIFGDPHLATLDGARYDLHVIGDFLVAASDTLEVHARFAPLGYIPEPCDCVPSSVTSVAVTDGDTTVLAGVDGAAAVDGEPLTTAVQTDGLVVYRSARGLEVESPDGSRVTVLFQRDRLGLRVEAAEATTWDGLLGDHDGSPRNDFALRDGTPLGPGAPARDVLFGAFADSWRLSADESALHYGPGETPSTYATVPQEMVDAAVAQDAQDVEARRDQAAVLCERAGLTEPDLLDACVFDFVMTGNVSFASESQQEQVARTAPPSAYEPATPVPPSSDGDEPVEPVEPVTLQVSAMPMLAGDRLAAGDGIVMAESRRMEGIEEHVTLEAIDLATGDARWTVEGSHPACRPAVLEGVGVVAELVQGARSFGAAGGPTHLALLSSTDGRELARLDTSEGAACTRGTAIAASGDVVVSWTGVPPGMPSDDSGRIRAHRVSPDGISELWSHELTGALGDDLRVVDGHVVAGSWTAEDETVVTALDLRSGEVTSTLELRGGLRSLRAEGEGLLTVVTDATYALSPFQVAGVLELRDGTLSERWLHETEAGSGADQVHGNGLAVAGDVVVGQTSVDGPTGLKAWSLADGSHVWTSELGTPNLGLVVGVGDRVLHAPGPSFTPAGEPWLEVFGADGGRVQLHEGRPGRRPPSGFARLGDGSVVLVGESETEGGGEAASGAQGWSAAWIEVLQP